MYTFERKFDKIKLYETEKVIFKTSLINNEPKDSNVLGKKPNCSTAAKGETV